MMRLPPVMRVRTVDAATPASSGMRLYASRTGTRRNLDAFRAHGWRILISATGVWRDEGLPYMVDCGAWTYHQAGEPFDGDRYMRCLDAVAEHADFIVLPDVPMDGERSPDLSYFWLDWVRQYGRPILFPVQNGMYDAPADPGVGIFIGGDDAWKERSMPYWSKFAHDRGAWCHVGRVNTKRRIELCLMAGVDSIDGSSGTRFAVNVPKIDQWSKELMFKF